MGKIVLSMQVSVDGRIAGPQGEFDWPVVGDELLGFFNDDTREAATYLYGRRMYEGMVQFWPTADTDPVSTPAMVDYARMWRPTRKLVFSDTADFSEWNTRTVRRQDLRETAESLRNGPPTMHVLLGGAEVGAEFQRQDLVDEYWLWVHPVVLGAGPRFFADLDGRLPLEHVMTREFPGGAAHLRYARTR